MNRVKTLCLATAALGLVALIDTASAGEKDKSAQAEVGKPAPEFALKDVDGKVRKLSEYKGSVVVLEWINQKCPFSDVKHQDKTMQRIADKYKDRDVVWLAIDSSHYADPKANKEYAGKVGIAYPILHDQDGKVGKAYGARTTPHMFVIDKAGALVYAGAIDNNPPGKNEASPRNYVEDAVEAVLKGSTVAVGTTKPYGCSVKYATK